MLFQLVVNGLIAGSLYALVGLGLSVIYSTTRVFHFAHGAVFSLGAYAAYVGVARFGWPLPAALLLGTGAGALTGAALELWIFAPLIRKNASPLIGMFSSLGLYVMLVNLIALLFGSATQLLLPGVPSVVQVGPILLSDTQLTQVAVSASVLGVVLSALRTTTWGKTIRAVRDQPVLAEVMGIRVHHVRVLAFALGSGLAGLAAGLTAMDVGADPEMGMAALLAGAVGMIVGGISLLEGAVLGGILLGLLESLVVWGGSARWTEAVAFVLLMATLALHPEGLLKSDRRLEEATV